ncbi:MAG: CopG family transcriptional regulator [Azoarcus sp.]|nr:CopG family transcriptional regulator [Azoarcus sp.]
MPKKAQKMILAHFRVPKSIEDRFVSLAKRTNRPKSYYYREALTKHIAGLEGIYLEEQERIDMRAARQERED